MIVLIAFTTGSTCRLSEDHDGFMFVLARAAAASMMMLAAGFDGGDVGLHIMLILY